LNAASSGIFEVGLATGDFFMLFESASHLLDYLPAVGTPGPLTTDVADPISTESGEFGGDVVALKLNVDFNTAGLLGGTGGNSCPNGHSQHSRRLFPGERNGAFDLSGQIIIKIHTGLHRSILHPSGASVKPSPDGR